MTPSLRQDMSAPRQREGFQHISSFPPCKSVFQIICDLAIDMAIAGKYVTILKSR